MFDFIQTVVSIFAEILYDQWCLVSTTFVTDILCHFMEQISKANVRFADVVEQTLDEQVFAPGCRCVRDDLIGTAGERDECVLRCSHRAQTLTGTYRQREKRDD